MEHFMCFIKTFSGGGCFRSEETRKVFQPPDADELSFSTKQCHSVLIHSVRLNLFAVSKLCCVYIRPSP
jgi:hypothetical protein